MLNEGLSRRQQEQREATYQKIKHAVQSLQDEGRVLSNANLISVSGLAPSTFSKSHVKKFLRDTYGIGAKHPIVPVRPGENVSAEEYKKVIQRSEELQKDLSRAQAATEEALKAKKAAEAELEERKTEIKILRGELDIAKRRLRLLDNSSGVKNPSNLIEFPVGGKIEND